MFRTGDLARRRADGGLTYVGSADRPVYVRGVRVDPGAVEAALATHQDVAAAAVGTHGGVIVGYLVPAAGAAPAGLTERVQQHLRGLVPDAAVTTPLVVLDALPLTAGGRIDDAALPAPGDTDTSHRAAAPRSEIERVLAEIWTDLLGLDEVDVHASFFELGGHSLLATQVVVRIQDRLGIRIRVRSVFNAPTIAALAAVVVAAPSDQPAAARVAPAPRITLSAEEVGDLLGDGAVEDLSALLAADLDAAESVHRED